MTNILDGKGLTMGTCYYPEHWPREKWQEDLQRMRKAGLEAVRVAEFAWSLTEPEEGVFTYDFWDSFLDLCEEESMKVIFCTPTATPPAWLTEKYPEVLNARQNGDLIYHGERRHYNYNSPVYLEKCRIITEKLGEHYGKRASIIGWQIDNEVNCENDEFYSASDDSAFRDWVRKKYGSTEALNEAWGTAFWNQTYRDFAEVHVPRETNQGAGNPHQKLDYRRFVSDSARAFIRLQSDILRKYIKEGDFVTTNGMFNLDNHRMVKESLDLYTYDSYPSFAYDENYEKRGKTDLLDRWWSMNLSEVRGICEPFGIMEQQSGAGGWTSRMMMPTPRPGQIRLWTLQSIAHGAEYISYFRWRTAAFGTEMYWHGILDYCGRDNRRLAEITAMGQELKALGELAGSRYRAKAALLRTWDNQWDCSIDHWHKMLEDVSQGGVFKAATRTHTPLDILYLDAPGIGDRLKDYELLIFPHAMVVTKEQAQLLSEYVRNGGKLILGCRAGLKTAEGHMTTAPLPGVFREMCGCEVAEFTATPPDEQNIRITARPGGKVSFDAAAEVFCDWLEIHAADVDLLAEYSGNYYQGAPALLAHPWGNGFVFTYGSTLTEEAVRQLLVITGQAEPFRNLIWLPENCELAVREKGEDTYLFVLNYKKESATLRLYAPMKELATDRALTGEQRLPGYGAVVYRLMR